MPLYQFVKTNYVLRIVLIVWCGFLVACSKTPDQEQIQQNLNEMIAAVEDKKFTGVASHLHKDFMANRSMDTKQVKQMLQALSFQHNFIGITVMSSKTTLDPVFTDKAETVMSLIVTGSSRYLPNDGSVRVVELNWLKEGSDWQIRSASWKQ